MKFQIKNISYSAALSEETDAYSCTLWVNGKKAGYAKNSGIGGCTEVRMTDSALGIIARTNAKAMLDSVVPFPYDYSKKAKVDDKGYPHYDRIHATERGDSSPEADLVELVDALFRNSLIIKECKKLSKYVTWISTECAVGECVRIAVKVGQLTASQKIQIEASPGFKHFLFDKDIEQIALIMGHTDQQSGPLTVAVSI